MTATDAIARAAPVLLAARSVVVFTGAGVSAESGVPTYRSGADGLWSAQNMERYANPPGYAANLPDSYHWYRKRAETVVRVQPNAGHRAIVAMAERVRLTVVTQNIDSLHQRAGSKNVIELHGHLRTARCANCSRRLPWDTAPAEPACPDCGGMLRPDVVMFYENLPEAEMLAAQQAARSCDLLISVGTSNQVFPAAELPLLALRNGAHVLIVNPDMSGQPSGDRVVGLVGAAGDILPALVDAAWP